jgi:hypothetical protein
VEIDARGDLVLSVAGGALVHGRPAVYQEIDGHRTDIDARYVRRDDVSAETTSPGTFLIGLELGAYDRQHALIVDPVLAYSTYLGGSSLDMGRAIAVDRSGAVYVVGAGGSLDYPVTPGAAQPVRAVESGSGGRGEITVTKLDPSQPGPLQLVYSTFLGGNAQDIPTGIAIDPAGGAYVTGYTSSSDFPTTAGSLQTRGPGGEPGFVTKLDPTGAFAYSTYLGTNGTTPARIAVDAAGRAAIAGFGPRAFPTTPTVSASFGPGITGAFVAQLDATGSTLSYLGSIGGSDFEMATGIALDAEGNVYITGATGSSDFPVTADAFQSQQSSDTWDVFVAKLDPRTSGSASLLYSTYLGGTEFDVATGIAVDVSGLVHVAGYTTSPDFPLTSNALQPTFRGGLFSANAFVATLDPSQPPERQLVYGTYLGGTAHTEPRGVGVDRDGRVVVAGVTAFDFPVVDAVQPEWAGGADGFVAMLDATGSSLVYSTYLGGSGWDELNDIAVDDDGNASVVGFTRSANFPTTPDAFQSINRSVNGAGNIAVAKIRVTPLVSFGGRVEGVTGTLTEPSELTLEQGKATFGGHLDLVPGTAVPTGTFRYIDHATGLDVLATSLTSLLVTRGGVTCPTATASKHVQVTGRATVNGAPDQPFTIEADDCGSPGAGRDHLSVNGTGLAGPYVGSGTLAGGDIVIR